MRVKLCRCRKPCGWHFELTVNTATIVENYRHPDAQRSLLPLVGDKAQLQQYAAATPIVDMVRFSPAQLDAEALIGLLRPLTPRLYSIASSQAEVESEVRMSPWAWCAMRMKAAPGLAAPPASSPDRVEEDGGVRVFIEHNDNFRSASQPGDPGDRDWPGHRVLRRSAPLCSSALRTERKARTGCSSATRTSPKISSIRWSGRAYVEGRSADPYRSGLVPRSTTKKSMCGQTARAGAERRWINDGAHIYVCGDANRMAKDVENTLLEVIAEYGAMDAEAADEFFGVSCALSAVISEMSTNERKHPGPLVVEGKLSDAERMKLESNYLRGHHCGKI